MTHTEAERATERAYLDVQAARDGLVQDLLRSAQQATTLVGDLLAMDDANADDLVFRLEKFYGRHLTVLADVAVLKGRLETLAELHADAAELEKEWIAAQDAKEAEEAEWCARADEFAMRWGTR